MMYVFDITGQLCTSVITTSQLPIGSGSAIAYDEAGSVCKSVLEHAALCAALDWCRRLAGGVGRPFVAQCDG